MMFKADAICLTQFNDLYTEATQAGAYNSLH
jgi:hypothetical protein